MWTPQRPSPHPCSNMFAEEGPLPFAKVRIFEIETIPSILPFSAPPQCGQWSVDSGDQQSNQHPPRASTCFVLKLFYLVANYYYYNQTKNIITASGCPFYIFGELIKLYIYLLYIGFMRLVESILSDFILCETITSKNHLKMYPSQRSLPDWKTYVCINFFFLRTSR